MATKYLITGGAGFIGSNLARRLLDQGEKVVVYDDLSTGRLDNLEGVKNPANLLVHEKSILDLASLKRALRGVDTVFHFAAIPSVQRSIKDPFATTETNVVGTLDVLEAARTVGLRRLVYASSSSVYGENPTLPKIETMLPAPVSAYAASKLAGEELCRVFFHLHGLEVVSLRFFNVFGPRQDPNNQYAAVVPKFITTLMRGRAPVIHGDGKQSRDFTYVDNVLDAAIAASTAAKATGEVINVACGSRVTIGGLANIVGTILGREITPKYDKPRDGDVRHSLADIAKAQELLGYRPRIGVEEGLRLAVDWFQKQR